MDIVEFFKTINRLCKNRTCGECPIWKNGTCMADFGDDSVKSIEETISKVEQWAKDNPIKTRQSEFLRMFPNAELRQGIVNILPCSLEKEMSKCCVDMACEACCKEYCLTEVTDND